MPWISEYQSVIADDTNSNFVGGALNTKHQHASLRAARLKQDIVRGETLLLPGRNLNLNRNPTKLRRNPLPIPFVPRVPAKCV